MAKKTSKKKLPEPTSSAFLRGYLAAALFTGTDESDEQGGEPLDKNYTIDDFSNDAIARAVRDTNEFIKKYNDQLAETGADDEQLGHDFWLTRNRHGTGFWDRNYPEPAAKTLTDAAHAMGECWVLVGDDNKIHLN